MNDDNLSDECVDEKLELAIALYDPADKYPEWSNAMMRQAYRAGYQDGQDER